MSDNTCLYKALNENNEMLSHTWEVQCLFIYSDFWCELKIARAFGKLSIAGYLHSYWCWFEDSMCSTKKYFVTQILLFVHLMLICDMNTGSAYIDVVESIYKWWIFGCIQYTADRFLINISIRYNST